MLKAHPEDKSTRYCLDPYIEPARYPEVNEFEHFPVSNLALARNGTVLFL